ncbi:glycoside hydrolase family 2 protein [Bacteroides sp. 51]|uniref:glycoside hydrolase family 2 protein n=1 Tax=Bacteroides sp. 51 TaxID=2302938 RepID=UPI0013D26A5F|nr:glycoside hydrolase family 2 TIM barrel-domain containing protein [Bacteroides sp. 51]NDV82018.1 glycoside hydrolase family 2 [Bacteroides sp. 51]
MKKYLFILLLILTPSLLSAETSRIESKINTVQTSVAGFIPLSGSGRQIYNFNPGWRYYKGDLQGAEAVNFDDSAWEIVSTPHTVELMPAEGSGCRNYQGPAWYRKRFVVPAETKGKAVTIHFEAVMGKQIVFLNGKKIMEHLGGYLPFTINLTENGCQPGDNCLIAVFADNSDDKNYPPGKRQYTLDFAYHGGIYRDVWMIAKSPVAITDAVEADKVAGGGVFVHYNNISSRSANVYIDTDIKNSSKQSQTVTVETTLTDAEGIVIKRVSGKLTLVPGQSKPVSQQVIIKNPKLWSPETPYLYHVESRIKSGKETLDGGITRIGIRKAEFKGKDGFWLNDKPYGQLVGTNRHQDFAYVGNAAPNSQQWRDAKRLHDAGCRIIRVAHYPMDPSFMDACDELGMFVIVATPGWQYWNKDPEFARLVHRNTREMIRRDRNHPSVLMWEPILNETSYPLEFALEALQITKDEFPYPGRPVAAADVHSAGVKDNYDVVYGWPGDDAKGVAEQNIFTREFGEKVDDWYAHNNNNRASRSWGERPQLVQALSLANSYDEMYHTSGGFIGGTQWHAFDHQRGYHPDPYWGGLFDAFRQPKYAYYMFKSQTGGKVPQSGLVNTDQLSHTAWKPGCSASLPMVYVAHEMSAFSDSDVIVFSNCDSVRLSAYDGTKTWIKPVVHAKGHMPNPPVIFENVWDFWEAREYSYIQKNWQKVNFVVEGIINGKVVCTEKKMPSRRSTKLRLYVDRLGKELVADGSDFIVVVVEVTDDSGNVRRLAKDNIVFTIEGEGEIIGDEHIGANPRAVEFGSAPVLIRSTRNAGKIKVKARVQFEGTLAPTPAEIEFESIPADLPFCFVEQDRKATPTVATQSNESSNKTVLTEEEKDKMLIEVERQQTEFGAKQ